MECCTRRDRLYKEVWTCRFAKARAGEAPEMDKTLTRIRKAVPSFEVVVNIPLRHGSHTETSTISLHAPCAIQSSIFQSIFILAITSSSKKYPWRSFLYFGQDTKNLRKR